MSPSRLVKAVYTHSRARYDAGHKNRWCKYTHALLTELGMEDTWQQGKHDGDEKAWDKQLREKIHEREEREWLERMQIKPKHRTYIRTHIRALPHIRRHTSTTRYDSTERRHK